MKQSMDKRQAILASTASPASGPPAYSEYRDSLLARLATLQQLMLSRTASFGAEGFRHHFHDDLSPAGWHLGHCVFTEAFWLTEVGALSPDWLEKEPEWTRALMPDSSEIDERSSLLPPLPTLIAWAQQGQQDHLVRLYRLNGWHRSGLLIDHYLFHFLIQHYAQHHETLSRIEHCRDPHPTVPLSLSLCDDRADTVPLPVGEYIHGTDSPHCPYDNEHPATAAVCGGLAVSRRPVSNGQYLAFMRDGGYTDKRYWCETGWSWREQNRIVMPACWERREGRYRVSPCNRIEEAAGQPVWGISWYEANAYATWAGGRLPHEREWEAAVRLGLLRDTGLVWEWCGNELYPYPGFRAFPYRGYSVPYFNRRYFVLRGGSRETMPEIRRHSFRNFYLPCVRSIFSGLRVVYD